MTEAGSEGKQEPLLVHEFQIECVMCGTKFSPKNDAEAFCSDRCRKERYVRGLPQIGMEKKK